MLVKAQNSNPLRIYRLSTNSVFASFFPVNILSMSIFSQKKGHVAGLNFHKQQGCGWLQLPSETNHLIKKKWADTIDADHSQCGDMSLQREQ